MVELKACNAKLLNDLKKVETIMVEAAKTAKAKIGRASCRERV